MAMNPVVSSSLCQEASIPLHTALSMDLPKCFYDVATSFPQKKTSFPNQGTEAKHTAPLCSVSEGQYKTRPTYKRRGIHLHFKNAELSRPLWMSFEADVLVGHSYFK